ncbi:hypothetical protein C8F01DRAFT_1243751 [Mycena amicta]|nr:hypothetical protein C8F01DRAFT_1243751 [Mycena amicta]
MPGDADEDNADNLPELEEVHDEGSSDEAGTQDTPESHEGVNVDVAELEAIDDSASLEETGMEAADIEFVMAYASCSRAKAVRALRDNGGDVVDAVMAATL